MNCIDFLYHNELCFILLCLLIQVLPNMASVVDIKAVSYDVCGVVQMTSSGYKAKVKSVLCSSFYVMCRINICHIYILGSFDSWP